MNRNLVLSDGARADSVPNLEIETGEIVGAANHANPIGLIVPCHRVIGADGSLTGYGGGLPLKRALLAHEAAHRPDARRNGTLF